MVGGIVRAGVVVLSLSACSPDGEEATRLADSRQPLPGEEGKLVVADGQASDLFGWRVALENGTALAGAPAADSEGRNRQGAAYAFGASDAGWSELQTLTAVGGRTSDEFGYSVAIAGDTALIGAYHADIGSDPTQGAAYAFVRSDSIWTQQAQLFASEGEQSNMFGNSVAISGDTALVGAFEYDDIYQRQGSAYVFERSGTTWTEEQQLLHPEAAAADFFGNSVALSGDTALIGAYGDDVDLDGQGSVHVFLRSAETWAPEQMLLADDADGGESFGYSVSLWGDTALIGAHREEIDGVVDQGSAYVFTRSAGVWTQQAKLVANDGERSDQFGTSVAVFGARALIGAPGTSDGPGFAYVFERVGSSWTQRRKLSAFDGAPSDRFGISVALFEDTGLVGAHWSDIDEKIEQGSVYAFVFGDLDGEADGAPCSAAASCASGQCVEGVCCDSPCDEPCRSCLASRTGAGDGVCEPVVASTDPKNGCDDQGGASCGTTGSCDGAGACTTYPAGTSCGAGVCEGNVFVSAESCNESGACSPGAASTDCAPYACGAPDGCKRPCTNDDDCAAEHTCDSESGECRAEESSGTGGADGTDGAGGSAPRAAGSGDGGEDGDDVPSEPPDGGGCSIARPASSDARSTKLLALLLLGVALPRRRR